MVYSEYNNTIRVQTLYSFQNLVKNDSQIYTMTNLYRCPVPQLDQSLRLHEHILELLTLKLTEPIDLRRKK